MSLKLLPLYILLFYALLGTGQQGFSAEYWEKNWRDWPRPSFDYRFKSFKAVENIVLREFFSTHSNASGEKYRHYVRFQYPDLESVRQWSKVIFQLPQYQNLKDVDFRIWEGEILLYEARATTIREELLDTLAADPHTGKLYAFSLQFPELKPGHIVEVMISVNGVPLPYYLDFHQAYPIHRSVQRIKIVSAFPLQFSTSGQVKSEEKRIFENKLYNFEVSDCEALSPLQGLNIVPKDRPWVWLDWQDQIFFYDREESKNWEQIIENLFYQGDLQDYAVYRNSLDYDFGLQQYYGSWIRPPRYFHERSENLNANQARAEGMWRLSKAYAERWLKVEEELKRVVEEGEVPSFKEALALLYESQKKASQAYLKNKPVYPPVFSEYGLLCSHYEALFNFFEVDYRLALFYPQRSGRPDSLYPSPWPAFARGLTYRLKGESAWRFLIPGPYFGQYFKPGSIPPDFHRGSALTFSREDKKPQWLSLPNAAIDQHGFSHHYKVHLKPERGRFVLRDTLHLKGVFKGILASAYLRSDSVADQLSFTNHQLLHNALLNDSLLVNKSKSLPLKDTLRLKLDFKEAETIIAEPYGDRDFALPMPFKAEWQIHFVGGDSLQFKLLMPTQELERVNPVFDLDVSWFKRDSGEQQLRLVLRLKKAYISKEELIYFKVLRQLFAEDSYVLVWSAKSS